MVLCSRRFSLGGFHLWPVNKSDRFTPGQPWGLVRGQNFGVAGSSEKRICVSVPLSTSPSSGEPMPLRVQEPPPHPVVVLVSTSSRFGFESGLALSMVRQFWLSFDRLFAETHAPSSCTLRHRFP